VRPRLPRGRAPGGPVPARRRRSNRARRHRHDRRGPRQRLLEPPNTYGRSILRWDGVTATRVCSHAVDGENIIPVAYTKDRVYSNSVNTGRLFTCSLADTDAPFAEFTKDVYAAQITASADRLFWVVDGTLYSCANGATCPTSTAELGKAEVPGGIVRATASGGELYLHTGDGRLLACDPSSCRLKRRVIADGLDFDSKTLPYAHDVATDDKAVYTSDVDPRDADGGAPKGWRVLKIAR
jgi:hypothetical protein